MFLRSSPRHARSHCSANTQPSTRAAGRYGRLLEEGLRLHRMTCAARAAIWPLLLLPVLAGCGPKVRPEELGEILVDQRDIPGTGDYVVIPELTPPGGRHTPEEMMRRMGIPPPEGMSFDDMKRMMEDRMKSMNEKKRDHAHDHANHEHQGAHDHEAAQQHDAAPDQTGGHAAAQGQAVAEPGAASEEPPAEQPSTQKPTADESGGQVSESEEPTGE